MSPEDYLKSQQLLLSVAQCVEKVLDRVVRLEARVKALEAEAIARAVKP